MSLFRRQLLLTIVLTFSLILVGFVAAFVITRVQSNEAKRERPSFFAKLVDQISQKENISPQQAAEMMSMASSPSDPFSFSVKDAGEFPDELKQVIISAKPYETIKGSMDMMKLKSGKDSVLIVSHPHEGFPPIGMMPPPHFGDHGPPPAGMQDPSMGPPRHMGPPPLGGANRIFITNFIALSIAILIASTLSVFSLFYSMRGKAELADEVLTEMRNGNLKARFPITKTDEVSQIMLKFNNMADEIQNLVERERAQELSRMRLLQELAHDLRTPIASLRTFLETMDMRAQQLSPEDKANLLKLSLKETFYFEHLVEDLLFLAQVTDPKYHINRSQIDLLNLLDEEIDSASLSTSISGKQIEVEKKYPSQKIQIAGDSQMLSRLVRNAFGNAFSFARSKIQISVVEKNGFVEIFVTDNGPGVSPETIADFGEKRASRVFSKTAEGRISVGLGSVIMRAIVQAHEGSLEISNVETDLSPKGAHLAIRLKKT